ncbi:ATP-binding protein [Xanthomonas hortorum]|nr:ATP-binding protein [Xanthomonas hortorum]
MSRIYGALFRGSLERSIHKRSQALDILDDIREQRYAERKRIAQSLSSTLGPRIKVSIMKAARTDAYAAALVEALRGSGIRYNDLASQIAENVSPRELVGMAEADDAAQLSEMLSVTIDRASRVLSALRQSGLSRLATVLVDDEVSLELLDGAVYKSIADLSTGQRCTTILPIVLQHSHRLVVVDQPEDHIDNAFIAETLVKAIIGRPAHSQLIVSTHNANIPVLGSARSVIQMGSDGRRGFIEESGVLSTPAIVEAITAVMEGGREAFARRAEFYSENISNDA